MTTPNLARRAWYLLGGRLPERYRDWVLVDAARPSWLAWFGVRTLLRMVPLTTLITLGLLLGMDAPVGLALACGGLGLMVGVYFMLSYAIESTEYRMTRYGHPHGSAAQARRARTADRDRLREERYSAAWRR
ncbi:DUF5313 family protein [Actinokineospora globicatena]|uniref:DUF5313 domain-containing protein n=1 Tax=Actinokineospora globicatena TaxID=103729 RepID=A0A9W6V9P3_9PSEU|nr:DUF5313 family protein [Actinokineospora globicatena]GLW93512.1 hypothetical protein Aglo03_43280 [Actinokineospora globicatena]